jgi:hypothetical protein
MQMGWSFIQILLGYGLMAMHQLKVQALILGIAITELAWRYSDAG